MTTLPKTPTPAAPGVAVVVPADEARKTSQEESVASGKKKSRKTHYPFWFGGSAASMAACVTHPLDLVKVRLQTAAGVPGSTQRSMLETIAGIVRHEGIMGFYSGLSASVLRQATYSTVRFGVYEEMKRQWIGDGDGEQQKPPSFPVLVAMASISGFMGGIAGNFADVLNVRMQRDKALPVHERRNYKHVFDGILRLQREEGVKGFFRGWVPNSTRAAVQTAGQLASYDTVKRMLMEYTPLREDTLSTQLAASFLAGAMAATVTNPVDVVKTKVMAGDGKPGGVGELVTTLYRQEGLSWVFKGWTPSFLRLGP
ncbi:uncharacterized protein PV06_01241 [Exophiala oligosperma]|uniref:Uncharacterized protein n=1 Tax=Exophiala oligosperma TaxID=215243 RepID=A0A0D2DZV2_9EURO|nr:uncharacterized protein PV06_01241 [Exophiala oligosperma]KIW48673.1 hypothetical protein PV06_01241 [Exophiala oligosperma]